MYQVDKNFIQKATVAFIKEDIQSYIKTKKEPFTVKRVLGSDWDSKYAPYCDTFSHIENVSRRDKTTAQQIGRLFKKICLGNGMKMKEVDDGKGHTCAEYSVVQ